MRENEQKQEWKKRKRKQTRIQMKMGRGGERSNRTKRSDERLCCCWLLLLLPWLQDEIAVPASPQLRFELLKTKLMQQHQLLRDTRAPAHGSLSAQHVEGRDERGRGRSRCGRGGRWRKERGRKHKGRGGANSRSGCRCRGRRGRRGRERGGR